MPEVPKSFAEHFGIREGFELMDNPMEDTKTSPIKNAIRDIHTENDLTRETIKELTKRLDPLLVILPEDEEGGEPVEDKQESPLLMELNAAGRKMQKNRIAIRDLLRRLEI